MSMTAAWALTAWPPGSSTELLTPVIRPLPTAQFMACRAQLPVSAPSEKAESVSSAAGYAAYLHSMAASCSRVIASSGRKLPSS